MATIEQLQARVEKLQLQTNVMIAKRKDAVIRQIHKLLTEHGLTADDLGASAKPRSRIAAKKSRAGKVQQADKCENAR
jgi:DNA-binding protein H-NS